ncbi:hypothetical protein [Deinococcus hopiensis]|uniref:TcpE family protein n=1 Tax=Deinococcus hopiensis KR-140 TaxID=695939 RepID=A0A1W1UA22_9DEIO|nr:hypothetical protein [Deinococcus hopiensis]SMB77925.1 hypothetical protein SAMN00790413_04007 [Deinococcus hopiensis KR-140]
MTSPQEKANNPLRHACCMTTGRVGFISYLDASDLIAVGMAFYLAGQIGSRITTLPPLRIGLLIVTVLLAWTINFAIKKRLAPYPKFPEYCFNWWFNGIDYYTADVDPDPVPLIVTKDMVIGHSMPKIEKTVKQTVRQNVRRQRVRKTGKQIQG